MKVTLDSIFGEILEEYPHTEIVLKKYLGEAYCLSCPGKMFDTIGNGASIHGLSDEEARSMLRDLQVVVDQYESGQLKREEHVSGGGSVGSDAKGAAGGAASAAADNDIIGSPWWVSWGDEDTDEQ